MENAFHMVLSKASEWWPSIVGLVFYSLPSADFKALEIPFFKKEVLAALSNLVVIKPMVQTTSPWFFGNFVGIL